MLPTHGRYEYSSIVSRPDYTWPGGRRLAVYLALNIEAFGFGVGKGAAIAPPDQAQSHSIYSWRDYGNRVGIWRLFELLDELGMPAEAQMNIAVYEAAPGHPGPAARAGRRDPRPRRHQLRASRATSTRPRARAHRRASPPTIERHEGARPVGLDEPVALQQRRHARSAAGGRATAT